MSTKRKQIWELRLRNLTGSTFFILVASVKYSDAAREAERFLKKKMADIVADHGEHIRCVRCHYSTNSWGHKSDGSGNYDKSHKYVPDTGILRLDWKGSIHWPEGM